MECSFDCVCNKPCLLSIALLMQKINKWNQLNIEMQEGAQSQLHECIILWWAFVDSCVLSLVGKGRIVDVMMMMMMMD